MALSVLLLLLLLLLLQNWPLVSTVFVTASMSCIFREGRKERMETAGKPELEKRLIISIHWNQYATD